LPNKLNHSNRELRTGDDRDMRAVRLARGGGEVAKLVVCLDGTNQTKGQEHPTNVALLFDALGGDVDDVGDGSFETALSAIGGCGKYLPGVGTQGNLVLKALGAAFGDGIAEPIVRGYTFLSRHYRAGDEIYIVGFSRGATAARALAGFVVVKGLLNVARYNPTDKSAAYGRAIAAWYQYREPQPNFAQQTRLALIGGTTGQSVPRLEDGDFTPPPAVGAVGVFDTVSSLGLPHLDSDGAAKFDFSICDTVLNPRVLNGIHALAADEQRDLFAPTYWADRERVVQHIFPGTHSNVGGGYPERGLSDGALDWMLTHLIAAGFPGDRTKVQPPIAPRATDIARDDGATFPFKDTPRRPRAFPTCATVDPFLDARRNEPVEMLPDPTRKSYAPVGRWADGAAL
jgi:uncharacterized protein (DUF2235 family)